MRVLRYIELKTGYEDNGPAWIAHVTLSRSGRTVYFNGRALYRTGGQGIEGNHSDGESEYWVTGVKKNGRDRHWAGSGKVMIEETAVAEYLAATGAAELDRSRLTAIAPLPATDIAQYTERQNSKLHNKDRRET